MFLARLRQILTDGARHEQYDNDRGRNPKGPVQIGVALHHVEKVLARVDSGATAMKDGSSVDVEELLVKGNGPQVAFRGGGSAACAGGVEEGGLVGLHLGTAIGIGVEGWEGVRSEWYIVDWLTGRHT